ATAAFFSRACWTKLCPSNRGPLIAKKASPGFKVRVSIEYPRTFTLPGPSSVPPTAALISSSVKFMEQLFGNHPIIERKYRRSDCLIRLMAFTGDEDGIAFPRLSQAQPHCRSPIDFNPVVRALHSVFYLPDDRHRIFTARVIGGNDRVITLTIGHLTHQRPFCTIAFAATAEHDDQPPGRNFARRPQDFFQCVVRVSVIDDDAKRLSGADEFESSRHLMQFCDAAGNHIRRYIQSDADSDCGANIKKVGLAHQMRTYR